MTTKEIAERLAKLNRDWSARCIRGRWVVWSARMDRVVEFTGVVEACITPPHERTAAQKLVATEEEIRCK